MAPEALVRWAQEHFLHAHQLTPWITDYVDLEESLSVGSIAQEELAHAAVLMELAGHDADGRDEIVYGWDVNRWTPSALVTVPLVGWPATVVRGLLLSTAAVVRTSGLGDDPTCRAAAQVLLAEQRLHVVHWTRWVRRLRADARTVGALTTTTAELMPLATDLFDAVPDELMVERLRDAWSREVSALLPDSADQTRPAAARTKQALSEILGEVRALRTTPDDGVLGRYR